MTTTHAIPKHAAPDADRLDALLATLIEEHRTLLALARDHRDALAHADAARLEDIVTRTGEVLSRISDIETERQRLTAGPDGRPGTMDELLRAAEEADRRRLSDRAGTLRDLIQTVQREHEVVRTASEALATHMRGLMQQVASKLSHAGTYGRRGRVEPVGTVVSGVDIGA
ncbi:MAG: flagellar protein FlgN [Phycisphaerales bacterium]|nr:flagellar protein FlgN [Planctomycetota bacterium]MCH8509023.1 flagellar protein FlgN [Phycisphaerales bacterium]